jgi:hypothetical protein
MPFTQRASCILRCIDQNYTTTTYITQTLQSRSASTRSTFIIMFAIVRHMLTNCALGCNVDGPGCASPDQRAAAERSASAWVMHSHSIHASQPQPGTYGAGHEVPFNFRSCLFPTQPLIDWWNDDDDDRIAPWHRDEGWDREILDVYIVAAVPDRRLTREYHRTEDEAREFVLWYLYTLLFGKDADEHALPQVRFPPSQTSRAGGFTAAVLAATVQSVQMSAGGCSTVQYR